MTGMLTHSRLDFQYRTTDAVDAIFTKGNRAQRAENGKIKQEE
jgi:hypothetical protein